MSKRTAHNKLNTHDVKDWAEQHNIILLDAEYVNNTHKHKWLCKLHNEEHLAAYDKIRVKGRLKCCSSANFAKRKQELVHACCTKYNIALVGEYKDSQTPTAWRCNVHDEVHETTRFNIEHSRGKLPCCRAGKHGHTLQDVQLFAERRGLVFVDDKFLGVAHHHNWLCKKHNRIHQTRYSILNQGSLLECCHEDLTSGPNHPNYNALVSDSQRVKDRRSAENKRWRTAVLQRDGYTCKKCGCTVATTKLNAHHIMSYLDNEPLRFNVDNGITLCVMCHAQFHKVFGKGSNNFRQLLEFMEI